MNPVERHLDIQSSSQLLETFEQSKGIGKKKEKREKKIQKNSVVVIRQRDGCNNKT